MREGQFHEERRERAVISPTLSVYSTHDNIVHPPSTCELASRGGNDVAIGASGTCPCSTPVRSPRFSSIHGPRRGGLRLSRRPGARFDEFGKLTGVMSRIAGLFTALVILGALLARPSQPTRRTRRGR